MAPGSGGVQTKTRSEESQYGGWTSCISFGSPPEDYQGAIEHGTKLSVLFHQHKIAALVSGILWLHFCAGRRYGDRHPSLYIVSVHLVRLPFETCAKLCQIA